MLRPDLCQTIEGAVCVNNPGSYSCQCSADNHVIQGDKCVEKPADPPQENKGMIQNYTGRSNTWHKFQSGTIDTFFGSFRP